MQQTQTYKLNKPGVDDPITPAPLNENADKIEAALAAETAARTAADAALDSRVQVLELHRMAAGHFKGDNALSGQFVSLGFTPQAVFAFSNGHYGLAVTGSPMYTGGGQVLRVSENGFHVLRDLNSGDVNYIAFA